MLILPSLLGSREITDNICYRGIFGGIPDYKNFCLLVAYFSPTRYLCRGSSFIFEFWLCKFRNLKLCRKGNGTMPLVFVSQQNNWYFFNYLYFLDNGNYLCCIEFHSLHPSFLPHKLHNCRLRDHLRGVCRKIKQNMPIPIYTP